MTVGHREALREQFRPDRVRFLFVGESPPASGRFFYQRDSGLYRAMRDCFQAMDPTINDANFIERLKSAGCYLIDLCLEPVDHLNRRIRAAVCRDSEPSLSESIGQFQPLMIITVVRSIEANVRRAAFDAGWDGDFLHLPYPGRWSRHREIFVTTLADKFGSIPLE